MKPAIFAVLLFVCAAEGLHPKLRSEGYNKLKRVFHGSQHIVNQHPFGYESLFGSLIKDAKVNGETDDKGDETEDSKGKPCAGPTADLYRLISGMTYYFKALTKKRDEKGHAFAKEFVEALKTESDDTKVKTLFGKHIRELHQSCESELLKFAKTAKACGLFKISESFGGVNLNGIVGKVIENVEKGSETGFIQEFLMAVDEKELGHHIFVKVLKAIGGLFVDAACDLELDGYGSAISDLIKKEQEKQDEEDEGANFCCSNQANVISKINCTCKAVKMALNQGKGYLQRQYRLLFQGGCSDKEASLVSDTLSIIKIMGTFAHEKYKITKEIIDLHNKNKPGEADLVLANYVLSLLRRATLVGMVSTCEEKSGQGNGGSRDELSRTFSKAKSLFNRKRKL